MRRFALLALAAGTVFAGNAFAASSPITGSFQVQATVGKSCVVQSTTGIDFGVYDPVVANLTAAKNANGSIVLLCTKNTGITVSLDNGANPVAASTCDTPNRRMASGTNYLSYSIDADDNTTFGCNAAAETRTSTSSTAPITLTTKGTLPGAQDVPAGSYSDTVGYTVTF